MAQVFSPPAGFDPPPFDPMQSFAEGRAVEEAYIARLAEWIRANARKPDPIVGKEVSWPHADGHARYLVCNVEPLELIHLRLGDGWALPSPHVRGLHLSEVRQRASLSDFDPPPIFGRP